MRTIFLTILGNSIMAIPFILVILAVRALTGRLSKIYIRALWLLLLVQLVMPPLFASPLGLVPDWGRELQEADFGTVDWTARMTRGGNAVAEGALGQEAGIDGLAYGGDASGQQELPAMDLLQDTETSGERAAAGRAAERQDWISLLTGIWLTGAAGVLLFFAVSLFRLRRRTAEAVRLAGNVWETEDPEIPFVMPGVPPRIFLPFHMEETLRENILAHERQHIRQGDPWIKLAGFMVAALHWYNPLVWFALRCMGKDMEMLCDEMVLRGRSPEERKRYSEALLACSTGARGLSAALPFGESNTESRIRHILYEKKAGLFLSGLLCLIILGCAAAFLTFGNRGGAGGAGRNPSNPALAYGTAEADEDRNPYAEAVLSAGEYSENSYTGTYAEDYDGDGNEEAFVYVSGFDAESTAGDVWYADGENPPERLLQEVEMLPSPEYLKAEAAYYLLLSYTGGNPVQTCVYTVLDGKPADALPYGAFKQIGDNGNVLVSQVALDAGFTMENTWAEDSEGRDLSGQEAGGIEKAGQWKAVWSGRTEKPYLFTWTDGKFEELPGIELSYEELTKLPYGSAVLEQADAAYPQGERQYLKREDELEINIAVEREDGAEFHYMRFDIQKAEDGVPAALLESGDGYYLPRLAFSGENSGDSFWDAPSLLEQKLTVKAEEAEKAGLGTGGPDSDEDGPGGKNSGGESSGGENSGGESSDGESSDKENSDGGSAGGKNSDGEVDWTQREIIGFSFKPDRKLLEDLNGEAPDYSENWEQFAELTLETIETPQEAKLHEGAALIQRSDNFTLYGADFTEYMILKPWDGSFVKIEAPFLSSHLIQPEIWESDFDGDGEKEAAIRFCVLHGTGVSVETLLIADKSDGQWQVYQLTEDAYIEQLERHFVTGEKDNFLRIWLDGNVVGYYRPSYGEKNAGFAAGSQICYVYADGAITMRAQLGIFSDENFSGNYYGDEINADVRYTGGGAWRLENFRYVDRKLEDRAVSALESYYRGKAGAEDLNKYSAAEGSRLEARSGGPIDIELAVVSYDVGNMMKEPLEVTAKVLPAGTDTYIHVTLKMVYEPYNEDSLEGEWKVQKLLEEK